MCLMTAGEVKDRHIVILDDLVQTGGTLIDCAKVSLWLSFTDVKKLPVQNSNAAFFIT